MLGAINSSKESVSFGPFELRPAERLLTKAGVPVRLGGRALDILIALVDRPGEVVSQRELYARAWPNMQVEESSLRVQIAALRRALGGGDGGTRYVENVPGRGYCFVAPLADATPLAVLPPAPTEPDPATVPSNLPRFQTALIGRARELAELGDAIDRDRLVTLVGTGGIGKTRLAVEFGRLNLERFADGVRLVDLAPLADPAALIGAVATVLGMALRNADTAADAIATAIGTRRMLLIFDNCEHLVDAAAALVARLLERAPNLTVLATSQESFNIPAERIHRLNPLALPPLGAPRIAGFGAVALFVERTRAADRRFGLNVGNADGVAEICRRLDGVPLALEMAAARLPLLGVEGLRAGLDERLSMLKAAPDTIEGRHRTLRNMMEWSHGLLNAADQQIFRRLGVFAGSFSLDAAVAVAGTEAEHWDVVDALGRLIDKSLIKIEDGESPRFRLLETVRLYAMEQLADGGEAVAINTRHARYLIEFFRNSDAIWETIPPEAWLAIHRPELDNVRAAQNWSFAAAEREPLAIALAAATARLWDMANLLGEGRRYIERAAALIGPETPPAVAARLLRHDGTLWVNADRARSLAQLERSAALYREDGDRLNFAVVLSVVGYIHTSLGRNDEAMALLTEAHDILRASDYQKSLAVVTTSLGVLTLNMNDIAAAQRWYTASLEFARKQRDKRREHLSLSNLAEVEFLLGATDRAIELQRQAVAGLRQGNTIYIQGWGMVNLASYLIARGDLAEARSVATEALSVVRELGGFVVRKCLERWALLAALEGRPREAAQLIGFVDAQLALSGEVREPAEQQVYERLQPLLDAALSAGEIQARAAEGARWTEAEAVEFALDRLIAPGPAAD